MTLNEILSPGEKQLISLDQAYVVAEKIKKECSNFLSVYKSTGEVLYRSQLSYAGAVYKGRSHDQRRTRDSSLYATKVFDALLEQMGIAARRSNSIFTSSDYDQTTEYGGNSYVILPTNSADFSWSRTNSDTVLTPKFLSSRLYLTAEPNYTPEELAWIKQQVAQNFEILNQIKSNRELARKVVWRRLEDPREFFNQKFQDIKESGYHLSTILDFELSLLPDFRKLHTELRSNTELMLKNIDADKVQREFQITDSDATAAVRSEHEVLIHGEYYAVSKKFWEEGMYNQEALIVFSSLVLP